MNFSLQVHFNFTFATGLADTGKFSTGVIDTGGAP
jgi:hypothetical protein